MPDERLADLSPELRTLFERLLTHAEGISEHALLQELRGDGALREVAELELFQIHFLLFHHLHLLRQALEAQGWGTLEIHCLDIRLRPGRSATDATLPTRADPLAAYYLDLRHLEEMTASGVHELLDSFWKGFLAWTRRDAALSTLGLSPGASQDEIRSRYRALCLEHHPDHGGDPDRFRAIAAAMESLRA